MADDALPILLTPLHFKFKCAEARERGSLPTLVYRYKKRLADVHRHGATGRLSPSRDSPDMLFWNAAKGHNRKVDSRTVGWRGGGPQLVATGSAEREGQSVP